MSDHEERDEIDDALDAIYPNKDSMTRLDAYIRLGGRLREVARLILEEDGDTEVDE